MGKLVNRLRYFWLRVRRAISPVYMVMLCASFFLWYIIKLQYTYTTNFSVLINVNGERLNVPCVVEGKGTNLLGYKVYTRRELKIPLADLKYTVEYDYGDSGELLGSWYNLDPQSVQNAISVIFSDIKVISVGDIPSLTIPENANKSDK